MTTRDLEEALTIERAFYHMSDGGSNNILLDLTGEDGVVALLHAVTFIMPDIDIENETRSGMVLHTDRSGISNASLASMLSDLGGNNANSAGNRQKMKKNRVIAFIAARSVKDVGSAAGGAIGPSVIRFDLWNSRFPIARYAMLSSFMTTVSRVRGVLLEYKRIRVDNVKWTMIRGRFMTDGNAGDAAGTRKVDVPDVPG
ncbi:hypothetical protein LCGC14_2174320 [marine sediment metagenome]|uniref:Uncharacterized protein n=1 Tax=marine sediment metagenome TaxID=412755 RepID=A0A0F9G1U2_9ZZZZ